MKIIPVGPRSEHLGKKTEQVSATKVGKQRLETMASLAKSRQEGVKTQRPTTRAECPKERPCPFIGCRYHLLMDQSDNTGSIKRNFGEMEPWRIKSSCALDLADQNEGTGMTLESVGEVMNLTRERVRQIEGEALEKIRQHQGVSDEKQPAL